MSTFKITIEYNDTVEASDEDEAYTKFWEARMDGNENLLSFVDANTIIKEVCPHCEVELESKMIDIDGTNLVEHNICPDCGYGTPALT